MGSFLRYRPFQLKYEGEERLRDYSVRLVLTDNIIPFEKLRSDKQDLLFISRDGEFLPYFIEDITPTSISVWIKFPEIFPGEELFWLYFGNGAFKGASDGRKVFDFFDDFNYSQGDLDGRGGWQDCGSIDAYCNGDGTVTITSPADYVKIVNSKEINLNDFMIQYKGKFPASAASGHDAGVVWKSDYLTSGSKDLAFYYRRGWDGSELLRHTSMPSDGGTDSHYLASEIAMDDNFHFFKIIYTSNNKHATAYVDEIQINQHAYSEEPQGKCVGLFIHEHEGTEFIFDWIFVKKYSLAEELITILF